MTTFEPEYEAPPGLHSLLVGLLTVAHERHMDLLALVSDLPSEALAWTPGPDAAHISGLVMHVLEVEQYLADVAAGQQVEWEGTNGSSMDLRLDTNELKGRIINVDAALKRALEAIPAGRLESRPPGSERTVGSMLVEDLDHSAMHYGQVQLTRHLYELAHPGFTSSYEHWR